MQFTSYYDSRVVTYDRKMFIRLATVPVIINVVLKQLPIIQRVVAENEI